jgi:hypothetical protein
MCGITRLQAPDVKPGMVLARDVITEDGKVLLTIGLRLTDDHIARLNRWQIATVDVVRNDDRQA